jgi:MtN3 and saliva related transmembrane protein
MTTDLIGWAAALILLLTVSSQVWKQWRSRTSAGVSPWLFIGQMSASLGFVIYSLAVDNMVFVVTNALLLLAAVLGQFLYLHNRHRERKSRSRQTMEDKGNTSCEPVTSSPP